MKPKNPAAVELGRLGGRATSPKKTLSSRANGRKGGGPRHQTVTVECHGTDWYILHADRTVQMVDSAQDALDAIRTQARLGYRGITLTKIEWRNIPEGFEPPTSTPRPRQPKPQHDQPE